MHFILIWFVHYLICSCSRDSWIFWEVLLNKNMLNRFFSQINAPVFCGSPFSNSRMKRLETCHRRGEPVYTGSFQETNSNNEWFFFGKKSLEMTTSCIVCIHSFIPFHSTSVHFIWSLQHWVGITTVSSAAPCNSWTRSAWSLRSFCSSSRIPTWAKVGNSRSRMWQGKVIISVNVRTWIHVFIIRE